jgi:hypothetical protein
MTWACNLAIACLGKHEVCLAIAPRALYRLSEIHKIHDRSELRVQ